MKNKNKRLGIFLLAIGMAIIAFPKPAMAQLADTPWPMFHHDLKHTGLSPYTGPDTNEVKWSYTTGGYIRPSPAVGADGTIYLGSSDNKLYAIYPNGTLRWSYLTGDGIFSSPAIGSDGTIYIGSNDNKLYAIYPNGTLKWSYLTGDRIYSSPAIGSDGTIYVGSKDDKLYAIYPDGTLKWSYTTGASIYYSSPAIGADGTIYLGSDDYKLYAIYHDGTLKWSYTTGGYFDSSPAIGADSTIYLGSSDNKLYAIYPDGTLKWSYTTGGDVGSSPAIGADGTIYVGSNDHKLYAIYPNGTLKWSYITGGSVVSSPAIDAAGTIYVGSNDFKFYAINQDGTLKWSYTTGGYVAYTSPAIGADGTIYVGSHDYKLYAFGSTIIGDFNFDGYVDAADLLLFGDHWHFTDTHPDWDALYDLVPDNIIDAADLQVFGDHWHEGTPPKSGQGGKNGKGPNEFAGIVFDLDALTPGNQNLTSIPSQPAGTYIRVDVYCTGVQNLDTYEFEVIYDPTELDYVTATPTNPISFEGNILESNGGMATGWMIDSSTQGVLSLAYTLAYADTNEAPEGEGLIADIVFLSLVNTHGTLSFGDVYFYDSYGVVDLITDTGTATLPVELAAFTATYAAEYDYISICWTTASETDVIGFNIYRSEYDDITTSGDPINASLISGHGTTSEMNEYSFEDISFEPETTYYYWLESIEYGGVNQLYGSIFYVPEEGGGYVNDFKENRLGNHPNPFKGYTTIEYAIKGRLKAEPVEIRIYNVAGQLVETIEARYGIAKWNVDNLPTGVYFYQLKTENYNEVKKMLLIR